MSKFLKTLSTIFLILFFISLLHNIIKNNIAKENATQLLNQYKSEILTEPPTETTELSTELITEPTTETSTITQETETIIEITSTQTKNNNALNINDSYIIGILYIPSMSLEMSVINETSDKLLNISLCRYNDINIGQDGNLIICGHNYKSGTHFGKLNKINIGDTVKLTDKNNNSYTYEVYETEMILPTEVEKVEKTVGNKHLTLFTCDSTGKKRFVVRCKEKK